MTRTKKHTVAEDIAAMRQWQRDHERHDDGRFAEGSRKMESLATKDDLAEFAKMFVELDEHGEVKRDIDTGQPILKFATKKDIAPVKAFYDKLILSAQIVDGTGKFLSGRVFWLAAFLLALSVITGKFWVLLGWFASSLSSTPKI